MGANQPDLISFAVNNRSSAVLGEIVSAEVLFCTTVSAKCCGGKFATAFAEAGNTKDPENKKIAEKIVKQRRENIFEPNFTNKAYFLFARTDSTPL